MIQPAVYIMANKKNGTIYIGVTSNLIKRVYEHKHHSVKCFTAEYDCTLLVFYERFETMEMAITKEKQMKKWRRIKKIMLIEAFNKDWQDLYESILG